MVQMALLCGGKFTDDATRVPLGDDGGYINASFIKIPVGKEEFVYIACQGPLPTTVGDFWQMIWEQKSTVIAMMTQEVEGEKIKCQRYWPNILGKTTMVSDRLRLGLVRMQQLKGFVVRAMTLEDIQVSELKLSISPDLSPWNAGLDAFLGSISVFLTQSQQLLGSHFSITNVIHYFVSNINLRPLPSCFLQYVL